MTRSVLVQYSPYAINEANIAHRIRQIPYYANCFTILDDYDAVDISDIQEHYLEPLSTDVQYYLFRYSDSGAIPFLDIIYQFTHIKPLLACVIDSCTHLLYALHLLAEHDLCMFTFTPTSIVYLPDYMSKPVLSHFRYSLRRNKLNYTYLSQMLDRVDDYTYLPLEVHMLYYIVKHGLTTVSYGFVDECCETFMESQPVLRLFSDTFRQRYRSQCIEMMRAYVNKPRAQIVNDLLERSERWDVYSISVLYVHLFGCISRVFSLHTTCIHSITLALAQNLHPDAHQRMTLEQTLQQVHRLLREQPSWSFVESLDNAKMSRLMDELAT